MVQKTVKFMLENNNNKFALLIMLWKDVISDLYIKIKGRSKKRMNLANKILSIPETIRDEILRNYLKESNIKYIQEYREWKERNRKGPFDNDIEYPPKKPRYIFLPTRDELVKIILRFVESKKKLKIV